jgi:glycolate oxidase
MHRSIPPINKFKDERMAAIKQGHHPLYRPLTAIVGSKYVADEDFAVLAYSRGPFLSPPVFDAIVVRPGTTEEVSQILKLANRTLTPVTLRGGGQSMYGFTTGEQGSNILIDLTRLDKVINIDEENRKVTYQGGIRPSMLDAPVREKGFLVNTVWMPFYGDTMAGMFNGTIGGGDPFNNMSWGSNWRYILGLKVVLPTGDVITTGAGPDTNVHQKEIFAREATAPDVTGLFTSSGGIFGIITEMTSILFPLPKASRFGSFLFDTQEDKWEAMLNLSETYPPPYTGIVGYDSVTMEMSRCHEGPGFGLFYSVEGDSSEEVDRRLEAIERVCKEAKGKRGTPEMDYYATHGATGDGILFRETSMHCPGVPLDALYPRKNSLQFHQGLLATVDAHKEEMAELGCKRMHLVMPRHANTIYGGIGISWDDTVPGATEKVREIWQEGADYLMKAGTAGWGCQGWGSIVWSSIWSPPFHNFIRTLKRALDPNNILCPGLWNL